MLRPLLAAAVVLALPSLAAAQGAQPPLNLLPPAPRDGAPPVPAADKPLLDEPAPGFQPIRPAETETPAGAVTQTAPVVPSGPLAQTAPAPAQLGPALPQSSQSPQSPQSPPAAAEPPPVHQPPPSPANAQPSPPPGAQPAGALVMAPPVGEAPAATATAGDLPGWALGVLVLLGAFLASLFGILTAQMMSRAETRNRRRAVATTLATELETRRLAFEAVPLPPNAEAGVSFVSSVTSLSGIDAGFRAIQGNLHLLPEKLAANVSVHYAAVQRVSDFVKGQSLAAAVRMLQANRIGGHPCPDAGTMREAHVELGAAFRGVDKLAQTLRTLG